MTSEAAERVVASSAGPSGAADAAEVLACPVCLVALHRRGPKGLTRSAMERSTFRCPSCGKGFGGRGTAYVDLTVTAGARTYAEPRASGTTTFQSPFVAFVYERGWRQAFARAGFPGAEKEWEMAQAMLLPARGGLLLDVSCGSGLFSRRFAASGDYAAVVALDFSESMLEQVAASVREDKELFRKGPLSLVRADVARLPFTSGSVDAVHAGAALHCWPSPSSAVAEISRILRPGGVFVATTFMEPQSPVLEDLVRPLRKAARAQRLSNGSTGMRYWEEEDLEELVGLCGLVDYQMVRQRDFIMLGARKPLMGA